MSKAKDIAASEAYFFKNLLKD